MAPATSAEYASWKELKLREALERVLILCPAPLTIQWQDELLRWYGEVFESIDAARDKGQLINPWQKESLVISSLGYAKQDDVRERVWQQRWDLVIIDEAHKCSAYTKHSSSRGDEVEKTKRYQLAEHLAVQADNLLLLTATPHHGDDDRFSHFVRLLDPDIFPEPHRVGNKAGDILRDILRLGPDCPWALRRLKEDLRDLHGERLFPDRHAHTVTFQLNLIEGRILHRLLEKLEQMRAVLADRIFDVMGEVLSLNDVNLPEMLREAAHDPRRLDGYLDRIEKIDPGKLHQYQQATGVALARANVDFAGFQRANAEPEERRLMPRYVEQHFLNVSKEVGLRVEPRADGLWRIEHVLADLRSDRLLAVRRLGKPEAGYRKATFYKEHLDLDQHVDAVLLGPGHPLYDAVEERLNEMYATLSGGVAVFLEASEAPYALHFFELTIRGQNSKGEPQTLHSELVAVREELSTGVPRFVVVPADALLDLPAFPTPPEKLDPIDPSLAADFLKRTYQMDRRVKCQDERGHFVNVCRE